MDANIIFYGLEYRYVTEHLLVVRNDLLETKGTWPGIEDGIPGDVPGPRDRRRCYRTRLPARFDSIWNSTINGDSQLAVKLPRIGVNWPIRLRG